jgi:hypothetical protein
MIAAILVVILMLGNVACSKHEHSYQVPEYKISGLPEGTTWIAEILVEEDALGDISINQFEDDHTEYLNTKGDEYQKADEALDEYCSSHGLCRTYNTRFNDDPTDENGAWSFAALNLILNSADTNGNVIERIAVYIPETGDLAVSEPVNEVRTHLNNNNLCIDCSDIANGDLKLTGADLVLREFVGDYMSFVVVAVVVDLIVAAVLFHIDKKRSWTIVVIDLITNLVLAVAIYCIYVPYAFAMLVVTRPVAILFESIAFILVGKRLGEPLFDKKGGTFLFALTANLLSLIGATVLISFLEPFIDSLVW